MAPVWNAALEALASAPDTDRLDRFAQRLARAPAALARVASGLLLPEATRPLRLVTLSYSGSVVAAMEALSARGEVEVSCSDSRPALEGRRLAARLASAGVSVTCFPDAAIGQALDGADAVLVGADAVASAWSINKSGTGMLAAAASHRGIPVYVVASRDKFIGEEVSRRLTLREGPTDEVWPGPPPGVAIRNPYFERIPLTLATSLITDFGALGSALAADVAAAVQRSQPSHLVEELI
jgi:translation initiation factor 2B subunit (eIF-2B alpha/beta/delta family)